MSAGQLCNKVSNLRCLLLFFPEIIVPATGRGKEPQKPGCWRFGRQLGLDCRREASRAQLGPPPSLQDDLRTGLGARFLSRSSSVASPLLIPACSRQSSLLPAPPPGPWILSVRELENRRLVVFCVLGVRPPASTPSSVRRAGCPGPASPRWPD